jgi:hypothetical protein
MVATRSLPENLRPYFWDYSFAELSLKADRNLIIRRVLTSGSWKAISWLRQQIGDSELRKWLIIHRGRGLSPRQLRFWGLILNVSTRQVNAWVRAARETPWGQR